jgi:ComF family protein
LYCVVVTSVLEHRDLEKYILWGIQPFMRRIFDALKSTLVAVSEVLLPERARAKRVRARSVGDFPLCPTPHELLGQTITTLLNYKDSGVSDLVRALKYEHSAHAAELCAQAFADYLREEVSSMRAFSPRPILLAPIPLHKNRVRSRGFNQMEKVLKRLPAEFKDGTLATLTLNALARVIDTPQQARLSRPERLRNVANAFSANETLVRGTHILLIDDVTTTGATLVSAARPLKRAGARVTLIALARA